MDRILLSPEVIASIRAHAERLGWEINSSQVIDVGGMLSIPVQPDTLAMIQIVNPDPDIAMRTILGLSKPTTH